MPIPRFPVKPTAFKVSLLYVIVAGWWFFASDNLISVVAIDAGRMTDVHIYRIWLFVALTALLLYILIHETAPAARGASAAGQAPMAPSHPLGPVHVSGWIPGLILAILTASIGATGCSAFQRQKESVKLEKQRELVAIGKLKAEQVQAWLNEHKKNLAGIAGDSSFMQDVQRWLTRNAAYGAERGSILARLEATRKTYGYEAVFLLDDRAAVRLALDEKAHPPAVQGYKTAMEAMQRRRVLITDVHFDGDPRAPQLAIDVLVPLIPAGDNQSAFGALYFRIDPRKSLFPLIQQWPFSSRSGESVLIRREGDDALHLNDLRHRSGTAMTMRIPLASNVLSSAILASGRDGVFEGSDYRGVSVISAAHRIPDTRWVLVTKADTDEIYAPIRSLGRLMTSLVALFIAVAGATITLWWRQSRAQYLAWQHQSEEKFRSYIENAIDAVLVADETGRFLEANPAACALYGYTKDELLELSIPDTVARDPASQEAARRHFTKVIETGKSTGEIAGLRKDGSPIIIDVNAVALGGNRFLGFLRDVTAQKEAERRNRLFAKVFENSGEAILISDAWNNILSVNRAFTGITGYAQEEVAGKNPRILASGRHDRAFYSGMWRSLTKRGYWRGEIWNRRKNGEIYPEWITISSIRNELGEVTNYVAVFSDISERKAAEERISFLAEHDVLTGLPNRILMEDRLSQAIAGAQRSQSLVALMFLDLDRFKIINDSLGHQVGDRLLQAATEQLAGCVRKGDTVSRVGGDEFVIILPDVQQAEDAAHVAEKMLGALARTYMIEGHEINVTASIGIGVYPHDGADIAALLKNADAAMYHAKQSGRNNYQFFTRDMTARAFERMLMENNLRRAIEQEQFVIHYQPQIDIASGDIAGIEALIRWRHPEMGLISPNQFIPVAEESGLILAIGELVLRKACLQNAAWQASGLAAVPVAINLSGVQFRQPDFYQRIAGVLTETRLDPRCLELEVTEATIMEHADHAITVVRDLQHLGVRMCIDDFGTGYSSFGALKRLPVYKLKLDQSFVRNLPHNAEDAAITRAIIGLAKGLKLRVVAEGVESREQLEFLKSLHCDEVQGYYFAKPLPAEECARFLRTGPKSVHP